jgi:hypothetical protein
MKLDFCEIGDNDAILILASLTLESEIPNNELQWKSALKWGEGSKVVPVLN